MYFVSIETSKAGSGLREEKDRTRRLTVSGDWERGDCVFGEGDIYGSKRSEQRTSQETT